MFGYIKVFQPQLKICEYEQYKAVYCALCRTMGKRYSLASRMTLSYDFTFLALFLMALETETPVSFEQGRCAVHPFKKRLLCCENPILDRTADVAILLMYHKLSDTVKDERAFKRLFARVLQGVFRRDFKKAVSRCPEEAKAAKAYMQAQSAVEASKNPCVDACAEPTAVFLATLSRCGEAEQEALTERFGYCLGRFVYLADAAQDLKEDLQKGSFNPYTVCSSDCSEEWIAQRKRYAAQSLHACVGACAECLESLPLCRFGSILYNVIYYGLPFVIRQVCEDKQEGTTDEKSI